MLTTLEVWGRASKYGARSSRPALCDEYLIVEIGVDLAEQQVGGAGRRAHRVGVDALDDQRMETLFTYWEGLVTVRDEAGEDIGTGYMELTGYD